MRFIRGWLFYTALCLAVTGCLSTHVGSDESPAAGTTHQTAPPALNPASGTYSDAQSVTITDATPGATIYYTTNGSMPTTSSAIYTQPLTVSASETINALAIAGGYTASAMASATYVIQSSGMLPQTATPLLNPGSGTYSNAQSVTITDATPGAIIYYTTNGSMPTTSSAIYTQPITVSASETINALAIAAGYTASAMASATYVIQSSGMLPQTATPLLNPGSGTYSDVQSVTITDATPGATIFYTTNGSMPTTSSAIYTQPITVSANETINALAIAGGYTSSPMASATYVIQSSGMLPQTATPLLNPGSGTYSDAQSVTIADATPGATIYYTTNGSMPTTSSAIYTQPITVSSSETINALAIATGYTASAMASATYVIQSSGMLPQTATPLLNPGSGTYSDAQSVTITDATPGATIYYTTNGSIPTTSSAIYTQPITVSASETINALAIATGYTASAMASATYIIQSSGMLPQTAPPLLNPGSGTYSDAQSVTITDATPGATIYYTTNGSMPTTSSAIYTQPITVSASETINALAIAGGYTASAMASATYIIQSSGMLPQTATPLLNPGSGTYSDAQSVTISDATPGATIYYTTNGSMPTTSSAIYTQPITVSASETINALAIAGGYTASAMASATYVIEIRHQANLRWNAPIDSRDPVTGYNIYRSTGSSSAFQLINPSINIETTYIDNAVQSGTQYTYYVVSVDASGNQSIPSNEVTVTIP